MSEDEDPPTPKLTLSGVYEQSSGLERMLRILAEKLLMQSIVHEKVLSKLDLKLARIERDLASEMLVHADRIAGWRKHSVPIDKRIEDISLYYSLEAQAKKIGISLTT